MIRVFSAEETLARAGQLAEVLLDCIAGGASVSFMERFSRDEATEYWRSIAGEVRAGVDLLQGVALTGLIPASASKNFGGSWRQSTNGSRPPRR